MDIKGGFIFRLLESVFRWAIIALTFGKGNKMVTDNLNVTGDILATTRFSSSSDKINSDTLFNNKIWMDSKEAANYLKISVGSLRNAVYRKQVLARKFRRRLYFKISELNRLLENSILL
jgi:hypothetical protein